ncbi:MAG: hypothetical protein IIX93_11315, partial [Clostridia bacterium]|nr:hypothetical protein [Clostridia bacterium]
LFASVCAMIVLQASITEKLMLCLLPLSFTVFSALFGSCVGIRHPIMEWTTEIIPLKQSAAVTIALFGGWGFVALFAVPYFLIGQLTGLTLYFAIWAVIFSVVSAFLYRWLVTKGAKAFSRL